MTGLMIVEVHTFDEADERKVLAAIQRMSSVLSATRTDQPAVTVRPWLQLAHAEPGEEVDRRAF